MSEGQKKCRGSERLDGFKSDRPGCQRMTGPILVVGLLKAVLPGISLHD